MRRTRRIPIHPPRTEKMASTLKERTEILAATKWANDFKWKQVEMMVKYMEEFMVAKDGFVLHEGSPDRFLGFVIEGKLSVRKKDSKGKDRELCRLGKESVFGEMSLVDGEPRSASIVALDDTKLYVLTKRGFDTLSIESPRLGITLLSKLAKLISQRLRQTSGVLTETLESIECA